MVKLTLQWEGPPGHHEGYPPKSHQKRNGGEGETQRAVVQSKQRLPLRLQSRHTTGIEEGEQPVPTGYTSMHLSHQLY